ncbi:death domain-associated protein 6 isoform X1 [Misgurnus anguillicaudatus]|uniref:death domain-associated protein 6 isoform X1 n=2 Tax=Misgurnus anguillicaudatus TaxID=75329 RepID=UPI003CCF3A6D
MLKQIHPAPFRMAGAVMESIVILDDDDEEASSSPSTSYSQAPNCQRGTPLQKQQPKPTHITQSPFATTKKDTRVLQVENEKLFADFVEHCAKHAEDHPEVMTYLQSRYSKALPTFLSSVEFRNTLGRCLTRAQANAGKTFVYINELCTVLKQHTAKKRTSVQPLPSEGKTEEKSNGDVKQEEQGKGEEEKPEEEKKTKRASRRQIAYLENLLKVYNEEIKRLQERELNLEDLEKEDSSYIQEHKLKRKMMKIYEKLCELKGCNTLTGRVIEQRIVYSGTRYPEINKKIERYINSPEVLQNPPDYTDMLKVVQRANDRYNLLLSRKQITQMAQEAFRETGNKLQERRHLDMVYNFGSHLTDFYKPTLDPALSDQTLNRKLRSNRDVALSNLEEVISKYANKQEDVEVEETRKKQERDRQKKEGLNGQQSDSKEKESEEQDKKEEEEEDDDEEDCSSDPDIEEEIQASQAQVGPDDDEEDAEEEQVNNSDSEQPINESSPLSIKSSLQDTEEDQGEVGDDDRQSPVSSMSEAVTTETTTDVGAAKQSPLSPEAIGQSEAVDSLPVKTELDSSNHFTPVSKSTRNCTEIISTNQDSPVVMRSANCSPLPPSPVFIDEMGKYKKRKRTSKERNDAAYNGNDTRDSSSYCDIPLDMGVYSSPERVDLTRATTPTQDKINSLRLTPPPKKNKVNKATQCDPEEVIVLSDSD